MCVCGGGGGGGGCMRVCVYVHLHDKITVKRTVVFWWGRTVEIRGSNLKSWEDESRWLCGGGCVCVCVWGGGSYFTRLNTKYHLPRDPPMNGPLGPINQTIHLTSQ